MLFHVTKNIRRLKSIINNINYRSSEMQMFIFIVHNIPSLCIGKNRLDVNRERTYNNVVVGHSVIFS